MKIVVKEKKTILELLEHHFTGAARATLRKKLSLKTIFLNDNLVINPKQPVQKNDVVTIKAPQQTLSGGIPIHYEDSDIIVVSKPSGLLSVDTEKEIHSLHRLIKRHVTAPIVYPVHRLDRDTSGLIVFALTTRAREAIKEQLLKREMKRIYHALVHGHLPNKSGTISLQVLETKNLSMKVVDFGGKRAVTHYEVLKRHKKTTLVECTLETGKKHQIRICLSHMGFPIVGDPQYGAPAGAQRMHLHACRLFFTHPITGKILKFTDEIKFCS